MSRRRHRINVALEIAFLGGLAGVFLVNGVVGVVDPSGFRTLVAHRPASWLLETAAGRWLVPAISLNDFLVGGAVLAALRAPRMRPPVLAWAGCSLMIVSLTKLLALG